MTRPIRVIRVPFQNYFQASIAKQKIHNYFEIKSTLYERRTGLH